MDRSRRPLPTRVEDLEPLPPEYHVALERGLEELGLELDPAARQALDDHARLLLAWTRAINLTAIRDPAKVATLHVLDSLAAVPVLRALGADALLDLGSGGGYPGLPLAIALPARAMLVESVGKKAGFLRTAVAATGLDGRVAVAAERAEILANDPAHHEAWPVVVARAVAALPRLAELALPLVRPGGVLVAWKRLPLEEELRASLDPRLGAGEPHVEPVAVSALAGHRLVVVPKVRSGERRGERRRRR